MDEFDFPQSMFSLRVERVGEFPRLGRMMLLHRDSLTFPTLLWVAKMMADVVEAEYGGPVEAYCVPGWRLDT